MKINTFKVNYVLPITSGVKDTQWRDFITKRLLFTILRINQIEDNIGYTMCASASLDTFHLLRLDHKHYRKVSVQVMNVNCKSHG